MKTGVLPIALQFSARPGMDPARPSSGFYCFQHKTRFLVLLLSTLCLTSVLANILTFNFTVICMEGEMSMPLSPAINISTADLHSVRDAARNHLRAATSPPYIRTESSKFEWSPATKSVFFGAISVGALVSALPVTILITRIGVKKVFVTVGAITTMATGLCPMAVVAGDNYFIAMRLLQGIALATCMPVIGCVTSSWATLGENGLFMGIATSFIQLAPVFTMPLAGLLCVSSFGWASVYYLHAIVSFCMFALWALFYQEKPCNSPWVGDKELERVTAGKAHTNSGDDESAISPVPYGAILRTPAIWAIWVATFVNFLGIYLIVLFAPTFINKILLYPIEKTGALAAIPAIVQFFIKIVVGPASDRMKVMSDTVKVKLTNTIAFLSMGLLYMALSFMTYASNEVLALVILFAAGSLLGFNVAGFFKSVTLVSRHHSHFVMGIVQMLMCTCMLFVPIIVQTMAPTNSQQEWHHVFLLHGSLLVVGNVVFCIFGSGKPAAWALDSWSEQTKSPSVKIAPIRPIDFLPTIFAMQNGK